MQAILLVHYKALQQYLHKLQEEEAFYLPCEHSDVIMQHEEKLKEIYNNYQETLEQVSLIIKQFDEHKQAIRRLMALHKQCHIKYCRRGIYIEY